MKVNAQHNALSKVIKTRFKIENIYSARCTLELLAELSVSRDCWRKQFDCFLNCAVSYSVIFATRAISVGYSTC